MSDRSHHFLCIEYIRKRWHRLDMTEKLLTGTVCINTNNQKKLFCHMLIIYLGDNNWPQQWQASVLQLRFPRPYIMLQY